MMRIFNVLYIADKQYVQLRSHKIKFVHLIENYEFKINYIILRFIEKTSEHSINLAIFIK